MYGLPLVDGGLIRRLSRFRRDEEGSLLIFGLFCFVIMLLMAGVALDVMRFEERRTTLQNTIDRAVLAAADLNQTLEPKAVVKDYFVKAGLTPPKDSEIVIAQGSFNEWRTVEAHVTEQMPTWFMNMVGVKQLTAPANGTAEERIGQVEISLVLDVSGSMGSNSRLVNLKVAAKEFIDTMFDSVEAGKISMSIITYDTQVSVGPDLMQYFNVTAPHTSSYCMEFNPADFQTAAMSFGFAVTDRLYRRNGHFDPFNSSFAAQTWNCAPGRHRDIIPFSGDRTALKNSIDALTADGNTSIDLGMKWGAALLDPSMQGVMDAYVAGGKRPAALGDRPYAYGNKEALKVVVVMTDGANTTEYKLTDAYQQGNSIVFGNTSFAANSTSYSQYSIFNTATGKYYNKATGTWRNLPYGDNSGDPGDAIPLTWPEVWKKVTLRGFADNVVSPAFGTTVRNQWRPGGGGTNIGIASVKDAQTLNICSAAKTKGATIFSIGFEAPTAGANLLRSCASSPAHYYAANGIDISTAFAAIASSINKLRLTQ
ncbi:MAG: pilus assembly protein TadG-related protein [Paracoccaceae bacterium]